MIQGKQFVRIKVLCYFHVFYFGGVQTLVSPPSLSVMSSSRHIMSECGIVNSFCARAAGAERMSRSAVFFFFSVRERHPEEGRREQMKVRTS